MCAPTYDIWSDPHKCKYTYFTLSVYQSAHTISSIKKQASYKTLSVSTAIYLK
jgi:hypothetical protein